MSSAFRPTRLYLGKLPYEARTHDIENFFRGYGQVTQVVVKKGYAFAELSDRRDAEYAVRDLNGRTMLGMKVVVEFAQVPSYHHESPSQYRFSSFDHDRPSSPSPASRHYRRSPTPSPPRPSRVRTPRAAEWYSAGVYSSSLSSENYRERNTDAGRQSSSRYRRSSLSRDDRERSPTRQSHHHHHSSSSSRRETAYNGHRSRSRSRSPIRRPTRRRSLTPSQASSMRRELPNLVDAMDEYEEEEVVEVDPFFKLLDHRAELEAIAHQLSLDINIRPFDASIAFGGIVEAAGSNNKIRKIKQEPGENQQQQQISEKWMVFADKGPMVLVSSYERNTLVREHRLPKFEWEPFSAAIKGMCEKFLLGK